MSETTPLCPYFNRCGGCQHQNLSYEVQLKKKSAFLTDLFHQSVSIVPHPKPYHYRNKMEFVCTPKGIGLRGEEFDDIVDIDACAIMDSRLQPLLETARKWIKEKQIPCYDLHSQKGFLRYITLRVGLQRQLILTTTSANFQEEINTLVEWLNIESVVWTINEEKTDLGVGETHEVFGQENIEMAVNDKPFVVGTKSFFQASIEPFELALNRMKEFIPEGSNIVDAYCGVGALGLSVSEHVFGVESNAQAIEFAKQNGPNATFLCRDASSWLAEQEDLDVVIVDPPRTGLKAGVHSLIAASPNLIIYLSCNPKTQRRDLAGLKPFYELIHLEGYDFFPQTDHVECLAILKKK